MKAPFFCLFSVNTHNLRCAILNMASWFESADAGVTQTIMTAHFSACISSRKLPSRLKSGPFPGFNAFSFLHLAAPSVTPGHYALPPHLDSWIL